MLSVLLLFISESIASVQIVVAVHISENGPECDKDWNASVTIDTCIRNICCKKRKKKKKATQKQNMPISDWKKLICCFSCLVTNTADKSAVNVH